MLKIYILGLSRSDLVIGNRARSRGFRIDRNRMLHPDLGSDIYFILTILITTIYFKFIITDNTLVETPHLHIVHEQITTFYCRQAQQNPAPV